VLGCVLRADKGDILAMLEKAESAVSEDEAKQLAERMAQNKFDFTDFLKQYKLLSGMGGSMGLSSVMRLLPGSIPDPSMPVVEAQLFVLGGSPALAPKFDSWSEHPSCAESFFGF
jgi:signal recognition particle GTPase